jgi:hypothetical protein
MKKVIIFVFVTFLMMLIVIDIRPQTTEDKPDAYEVIKYINNNLANYPDEYNDFYLLFDQFKLDSNNFDDILSFLDAYEYKIIEVYPYINPMYQSMLDDISIIPYRSNTLNEGISTIYKTYMKELEDNHLNEEIDRVLINGIRIRMIKINTSNNTLNIFLNKFNTIKYSTNKYGLFKTNNV